jgi:tetratricopeptide (TPR) repeat protein
MFSSLTRRLLVAVLAVFAAFTFTAPLFAQNMGSLSGKCKAEDGKPLAGYTILIERKEMKWSSKTKTDKKGNYIHIGLSPGDYVVTLISPTGQNIDHASQHVAIGEEAELNFDLAKEKAQALKQHPDLGKRAEEQVKDQKQSASLKAVFDQAQALYTQKQYSEAAAKFEEAMPLAKDKNVTIVLARLADAYGHAAAADTNPDAKKRDGDKAVEDFQKVLQLSPNDPTLHSQLGGVYAQLGKADDAGAECKKAADINPAGASNCYYNLGVIMYNQTKMDEAAAALKKSTEADPNNANAFYWYGTALMGKAKTNPDGSVAPVPGTIEAFQTYLKLEPSGPMAATAQASIEICQGKVPTEYKKEKKK